MLSFRFKTYDTQHRLLDIYFRSIISFITMHCEQILHNLNLVGSITTINEALPRATFVINSV